MKIESEIGKSIAPSKDIYSFISDFRNFKNFIPENTVSNWSAEERTCSFSMDLLGKVGLKIEELETNALVKIASDPLISQYNFTLWIQIKELAPKDSKIKVTIEPQLNQIMLSMVKGQLKNFVDSLVKEIENFDFPPQ